MQREGGGIVVGGDTIHQQEKKGGKGRAQNVVRNWKRETDLGTQLVHGGGKMSLSGLKVKWYSTIRC